VGSVGGWAGKGPYGVWKGAKFMLADEFVGREVLGLSVFFAGDA
jgi:hypothetical protein